MKLFIASDGDTHSAFEEGHIEGIGVETDGSVKIQMSQRHEPHAGHVELTSNEAERLFNALGQLYG